MRGLLILSKKEFNESSNNIKNLKDPVQIANNISSNLNIQIYQKQELLEITDIKKKTRKNSFINRKRNKCYFR